MRTFTPFLIALTCLIASTLQGQAFNYNWLPTNTPANSYRFDDVYFLDADRGWAVNFAYSNYDGYVTRTTDGGSTWDIIWDSTGAALRDIGFTDSLHGWIGTLENGINPEDTVILYQTTDAGNSWSAVPNLPGPRPAGICGMQVINDSTVYAVGRYPGPAGFYKTTNNGQSWSFTNCSAVAGGLVDLHFFTPDTGFAIGTNANYFTGKGRVIATTDGGDTWSIVHTSAHINEICWKIEFPSRQRGYISLQAFNNTGFQYFLRTTDGGATWADVNLSQAGGPTGNYNVEGIGFIDELHGWIGGDVGLYYTANGGSNWSHQSWGNTLNRFRKLNDSTAYFAGEKVYKMERLPVSIQNGLPSGFMLAQNSPNPIKDETVIEFHVPVATEVQLTVYNVMGQPVKELINDLVPTGNHRIFWSVEDLPDGPYFYTMRIGERSVTKRMIVRR